MKQKNLIVVFVVFVSVALGAYLVHQRSVQREIENAGRPGNPSSVIAPTSGNPSSLIPANSGNPSSVIPASGSPESTAPHDFESWYRKFWMPTAFDPAIFWVMLTALFTFLLALIAWKQLGDLRKTQNADFIHRLKDDFFTVEARKLYFLIEYDLLVFEGGTAPDSVPYFRVARGRDDVVITMRELGINAEHPVTTYAVDDAILGPLEDVGFFEESGVVSIKQAYVMFDTYVEVCAQNEEIKKYIDWLRSEPGNSDTYEYFTALNKKLKAYREHVMG